MRSTHKQFPDGWTKNELQDFFTINLGQHEMWERLRIKHGIPGEQLSQMLPKLMEAEEIIDFMGGREVVDSLHPRLREGMILTSTLRWLIEQYEPGGAWGIPAGNSLDNPSRGQYQREVEMDEPSA
jgi:hypothetical protein